MKKFSSSAVAWVSAAIVVGSFVTLSLVPRLSASAAAAMVPWVCVLGPVSIALTTFFTNRDSAVSAALLSSITPAILLAGALGTFMTVEGDTARLLVAATTIGFSVLFLAYWHGMGRGDVRFSADDFAHLSFALHVVAMFFVLVSVFGLSDFLTLPLPAVAGIAGAITLVTVAETMRRAGLPRQSIVAFSATMALIMAEATVALSELPTGNLVDAMMGVVVYATCLHAATAILQPSPRPPALRRHFALSFAIVILVLSTARWA